MINECTVHNNIDLAIFVQEIVEVGGNLTKLCYLKTILTFCLRHGVK